MERKFEVVSDEFRVHPEVKVRLPERADGGACAYDFRSCEDFTLMPGEKHLFFTDIKAKMFFDNHLDINTRSGNGVKHGISLANSMGWIDNSYYNNPTNDGNIGICLVNEGKEPFIIRIGDRIAQGRFGKNLITSNDKWKDYQGENLREGGFGSSGRT